MRMLTAMALCAASLALTGCFSGGGGDDPAAPVASEAANSVPTSAWASPSALVSYSAGLGASDGNDPLDIDTGVEPVSETAEPEDI